MLWLINKCKIDQHYPQALGKVYSLARDVHK